MVSISLMCTWIDGWTYNLSKDSWKTVIFAQLLACNLFGAKAVGSEWWEGMAPFPAYLPHFHSTNLYDQSVLKTPEFTAQYFNADLNWYLLQNAVLGTAAVQKLTNKQLRHLAANCQTDYGRNSFITYPKQTFYSPVNQYYWGSYQFPAC